MAQLAQSKLDFVEEFLSLSRHAIASAVRPEVDAAKAEALALKITEGFLSVWGGSSLYLPQANYLAKLRRDREIYRRFTGGELEANQLAREFGVSVNHVYRICREERARNRREAFQPLNTPQKAAR